MQREANMGFPSLVIDWSACVLSQNLSVHSGGYVHIIDLARLHISPVLFCNVIFTLDLSFHTRSDLFVIQGKKTKQVLH